MREKLKNGLIVLLIITAILLGWQSRLFGNTEGVPGTVMALLHPTQYSGVDQTKTAATGAAKPISIAVTNDISEHFGIRYDLKKLDDVYNGAVSIMSNAFGSAASSSFRKADAAEWRRALQSPGVYFEYLFPVKISVLNAWFGTKATEDWSDLRVRRLCVAVVDNKTRLYFQQYDNSRFYVVDTSEKADITRLSSAFGTNGATFAYEVGTSLKTSDAYALLIPNQPHYVVKAENPLETMKSLTDAFSSIGLLNEPYKDAAGTDIFIDNNFTLRVEKNGTAFYKLRDTSGQQQTQSLSENEMIELARMQVLNTIGLYCGDAAIYFESIQPVGSEVYQVTFRYIVAGGLVQLGKDGLAAKITIHGTKITEMELRFRNYTKTEEEKRLLPEIQAAAASSGRFTLCYPDDGSNQLEPCWIEASDEPSAMGGIG